jgi:chorismate mutase
MNNSEKKINNLRKEIDQIHKDIFNLILKRITVTNKIFKLKKISKIKLTDKKRENELTTMFEKNKKINGNPPLQRAIQNIQKIIIQENKKYLLRSKNAKI